MESHFEDAEAEPRAMPQMWSAYDDEQLVGFVMITARRHRATPANAG